MLGYAEHRLKLHPVPLDRPRTEDELFAAVGQTVTRDGLGGTTALALFAEHLAPACLSTDHPRYLSFIPCAPSDAAAMFDLVVGASSIYAGSWMEGAGAVFAENQALRWIADLVALPPEAGGVFVPGGTIGNLSALVSARHTARLQRPDVRPWRVAATDSAHSSIESACAVMDAELIGVPLDDRLRLTGETLRAALLEHGPETFFAVVATCGTTNFGVIDDLAAVAAVCAEFGIWFHVDGAYGGAGLAAPSIRGRYAGIEQADSFIVLDVLTDAADWNPTDYAIGLTRRARGLPFWFSLSTNGTQAYTEAIERTLEVTRFAAAEINRRDELELLREPDLSVVVFRRHGWASADYHAWSDALLDDQLAFVVPTTFRGETLARFAIVNPLTTEADITAILDTMTRPRE